MAMSKRKYKKEFKKGWTNLTYKQWKLHMIIIKDLYNEI